MYKFTGFTQKANSALNAAVEVAENMGHTYVGSEHLTATHTALYRYLQPVVATTLAVVRGQSNIDRANVVGAALIFLGILFVALSTLAKSLPRHARQRR